VLYGVNFGCIQKVINRVSWAHIPEEDYPHPALLKADGTRTIRRAEDSGPQHSKLTEDEVREIKQMIQQGIPTIDIAEYYRISRSSVRHIATGKRWAHVV
jgi:DNA-binding NarL/FixJ family response regulator